MDDKVKRDKFVDYEKYCATCKFKDVKENEDGEMPEPCNTCLTNCTNEYSHKPTEYIKAEESNKKKSK